VGQATNLGAAFDQHKSAFLISLISLTYRWQLKKEAPALTGAELGNNMIAGRISQPSQAARPSRRRQCGEKERPE
jgi:hypothetical protein